MSSYISDHSSCQCGLQRDFFFFPEIALRCTALICSVLSSTWESDLAVKANSTKDAVWSEALVSCQPVPCSTIWLYGEADCLHSSSHFPMLTHFRESHCLSIPMVAPCSNQFSQELLILATNKESIEVQRVLCLTLSLILLASLISSWCNEAEPDLYSDCPSNCLIWENRANGPIFPACPPLMTQTGVQGAMQCKRSQLSILSTSIQQCLWYFILIVWFKIVPVPKMHTFIMLISYSSD